MQDEAYGFMCPECGVFVPLDTSHCHDGHVYRLNSDGVLPPMTWREVERWVVNEDVPEVQRDLAAVWLKAYDEGEVDGRAVV